MTIRTFDAEPAGTLPKGFELAQMRQETPGQWRLRRTGSNGYLTLELQDGSQLSVPAQASLSVLPSGPTTSTV